MMPHPHPQRKQQDLWWQQSLINAAYHLMWEVVLAKLVEAGAQSRATSLSKS